MAQHRILIITLSNIGDAVMTTPVFAALHALYPDAQFDVVCDIRSAALFAACPYIGKRYVRDKKSGWLGYYRLIKTLRATRYDWVVDLRTDFLAAMLKANIRFVKLPSRQSPSLHAVEKHLAAIKPLVGEVSPKLSLWASTDDRQLVNTQFPVYGNWLAIGLGANFSGKIWPVERYLAVANTLQVEIDGVVLLGNQEEQGLAQTFVDGAQLPVYSACGKLTLPQTYALLQQCACYLGNDSGLGHMAAAAGLPTLTLFGPGSPSRYLPCSPAARYLQDPAQDILGITVEAVVMQMQQMLHQQRQQRASLL